MTRKLSFPEVSEDAKPPLYTNKKKKSQKHTYICIDSTRCTNSRLLANESTTIKGTELA
jgi:hypothetical protein